MSTGARACGRAKRGFALLAILTLASCVNTDEHTEWQTFKNSVTDAVLRRDFDAVYPLVRAEFNREALEDGYSVIWIYAIGPERERFVAPEDGAVFGTGLMLAGGLELTIDPAKHPEDYNEKLREPSLLRDRFRAAAIWFRRAADRGVVASGEWLAGMYQDVLFGMPLDDELAKCFMDAARSQIVMTICRRLEQAKGYDRSP